MPWESIAMDFVGPFPRSGDFDYLWVVICRLTSMVHLIPVQTTVRASDLAALFLKEIVRLHGVPDEILLDRDSKFTSKFWREVHRLLGIRLLMSTAFHPETDGISERNIRTIVQILRALVEPDQTDWVDHVPLVEFAINSSVSKSTGFAPFELNSGFLPRMTQKLPSDSDEVPAGVRQFAERALDNLVKAHDALVDSRVIQTHHANRRRRDEDEIDGERVPLKPGDLVYLSTANLRVPSNRARKLVPKFIGPYKILDGDSQSSSYTLELPADLAKRGIHPKFHVSLLRRFEPNDAEIFPHRETRVYYDLGADENEEFLVDELLDHHWKGKALWFKVKWSLGDETLEPVANVDELEALDRYLELHGVRHWKDLPKGRSAKRVTPS